MIRATAAMGAATMILLSVFALLAVPATRHTGLQTPSQATSTCQRTCQNTAIPLPDTSASLLQSDFVRTRASHEHTTHDDHAQHSEQAGAAVTGEINEKMNSKVEPTAQRSAQMVPAGSATIALIPQLPAPAAPPQSKCYMLLMLESVSPWVVAQHLRRQLGVLLDPLGISTLQTSAGNGSNIILTTVALCILMIIVLLMVSWRMSPSTLIQQPPRPRQPRMSHTTSGMRTEFTNVYRTDASISRLSSYSLKSVIDLPSSNHLAVHVPPSAQALAGYPSSTRYLCPELAVPHGSECTLLIPPVPLSGTKAEGHCTIDDLKGCAVFKAVFTPWEASRSADGSSYSRQCIRLESVTGTTLFAYCSPFVLHMDGQRVELEVFRQGGEPFGVIRRNTERGPFSVFSRSRYHWQIDFDKDFAQSPVQAEDENGTMVAFLENQDEGRWLIRVAPLGDAGLMVISVLGVLLLQQRAVL